MKYVIILLLLTACTTGFFVKIPEETGTIEVFFCDQVNCTKIFQEKANNSDVSCALYHATTDFDMVNLVVDGDHPVKNAIVEQGSGLMHNKFCIIDSQYVWTGSWNPTQGMKVPNNVVLIQSKTLAEAYQAEFDELSSGIFHGGVSSPGVVTFNGQLFEAYFCPEDDCQEHVLTILETAKESIHFMTFSFTDDEIGKLLVEKSKDVDVKGIFDPRKNKYSEYEKLKDVSIIKKVHHKVFIIDGHTVITGSYNPSRNANERNDENIIIIRDAQIAKQFENEFARLFD